MSTLSSFRNQIPKQRATALTNDFSKASQFSSPITWFLGRGSRRMVGLWLLSVWACQNCTGHHRNGWQKKNIGVWISCFFHRSGLHWQRALNGWLERKMWQTEWFLTWSSRNINMSSVLPFNSPSDHWQNNLDSSFRFRGSAGRRGRVNLFTWGVVLFILFYFFKPDVNYPCWQVNGNSCMYLVFSVTYANNSKKHVSFWGECWRQK